jgi:hypothetical protein
MPTLIQANKVPYGSALLTVVVSVRTQLGATEAGTYAGWHIVLAWLLRQTHSVLSFLAGVSALVALSLVASIKVRVGSL